MCTSTRPVMPARSSATWLRAFLVSSAASVVRVSMLRMVYSRSAVCCCLWGVRQQGTRVSGAVGPLCPVWCPPVGVGIIECRCPLGRQCAPFDQRSLRDDPGGQRLLVPVGPQLRRVPPVVAAELAVIADPPEESAHERLRPIGVDLVQ